jgi:hypothetical protein
MRLLRFATLAIAMMAAAASLATRQAAVTAADLTRLEAAAGEIETLAASLKKTDATLAAQVEKSLVELREEIVYLRVRLRRDGAVPRAEYADVRDRLETLRVRAGGQKVTAQAPVEAETEKAWTVPVGAEIDVRLQTPLNSGTAKLEQRFETTTILDLKIGSDVVVPAGTLVRGFVSSVSVAGRISRRGSLTLSFDEIRIGNRSQRFRGSVLQALDGKMAEDVTRIGAGAAVGAIIGGILGGGKGALLGVLVGGGGTIAATEGVNVDLPAGTILRIRVDQPLEVVK